jgi:hypothetical protein
LITSSAPVTIVTTSTSALAVQINLSSAQTVSLLGGDIRRMA